MKETTIEHNESVKGSPAPDKLSSPHFDESAVAAAHPVEPLKPRAAQTRFVYWPWRWPIIASAVALTVFAAAVIAVVIVRPQLEAVVTSASVEPQPSSQPIQVATPRSPATAKLKVANGKSAVELGRPKPRTYQPMVVEDEGKPVARKVGVLYGRKPVRP